MVDRIIFFGLLFLLLFTPLAFGTTESWSVMIMVGITLSLTLLYVWDRVRSGSIPLHAPALYGLFLLFTLLVFGQTLSLPPDWASLSSLGMSRATLSVDGHVTQAAAAKVFTYLAIFYLVPHFFPRTAFAGSRTTGESPSPGARLFHLVDFLIFLSFGMALFALVQHFTFNGKIYWVRELSLGGQPFGPFVNRNHYAGYMELTIPLVLALVFTKDALGARRPLYLFFGVIMAGSLLLSLSRTGIISLFCQLPLLLMLLRLGGGPRRLRAMDFRAPGVLLGALVLLVFWIGAEPLAQRLGALITQAPEQLYPGRYDVWLDTLVIITQFPWVGGGLGTFPILHAIYKSRPTDALYMEAHNDYLQILAETGVVGGALLFLFGLLAIGIALRAINRERDASLLAVRAGALTGCLGILIHSLTDFNLQIPSNALLFFILVGVATMPTPRFSSLGCGEVNGPVF